MLFLEPVEIAFLLTLLAGLSTGVGSLIAFFIKKSDMKQSYLCVALGFSAGVMIYISFTELLAGAVADVGFVYANIAFFSGIVLFAAVDFLIPHEYIAEKLNPSKCDPTLMKAGVFCALGIAIHNFPEGIAVFMASLKSIELGLPLAFAIALHNIPEGIAVSIPIYYATKKRRIAFFWSLLAGVAEPLGAVLAFLLLAPFLNDSMLSIILAAVGGMMVFISFDELLPLSFKNGASHIALAGFMLGMAVTAASIHLI